MSDLATIEKKNSSTLNKSQLVGYERPNFYHKSKSTKKNNSQFSNTNLNPKVLGNIKVKIEPFSSKAQTDTNFIDLSPNNDYDSEAHLISSEILTTEPADSETQLISSDNINTTESAKNESSSPSTENPQIKVFSPPQQKQQFQPKIKQQLNFDQIETNEQEQPKAVSENTKTPISNKHNKTKPSSQPQKLKKKDQNDKNKTPTDRYIPQSLLEQKNKRVQSTLSTTSKSNKSGNTSSLTPQPKERSKSPRRNATKNSNILASPPRSPKKDIFLPGETITSRALKNLGFAPEDLEYPSEARINEFTKNNALKPYVRQELCKDVDERIALFNQEKERLKGIKVDENEEVSDSGSFEKELIDQKKEFDEVIQRTYDRQKHEIEFKIFVILVEKYRKLEELRKQQAAEQRHEEYLAMIQEKHKIEEENNQRRQAFFQQKELDREARNQEYKQIEAEKEEKFNLKKEEERKEREKKIGEFDRMKQERLDMHYEIEKQRDIERHSKLQTRLKELEERTQRVKQMQQQQQQVYRAKNEKRQENHEQLMAGIVEGKQRQLEQLKNKLAERDLQLKEKLKELDREKQQIIEDRKVKTENCIQRAKLIREEKQKVKINEIYKIREQKAEEYNKQLEAKRIERLAKSAEIDREIKERLRQLQEEKDEQIQRRHDDYMEKDSLRTKQIESKRQQDAAEREMEALRNKIDMSRRQFSLLVHERQKAGINQDKDFEMREKMQKIKEKETKKRDQVQFLVQRSQIAESNRRYMVQQAQDELYMAKTENQLRIIAESYGIDFDSIDALARDPRSSKKTVSDFLQSELYSSKNEK